MADKLIEGKEYVVFLAEENESLSGKEGPRESRVSREEQVPQVPREESEQPEARDAHLPAGRLGKQGETLSTCGTFDTPGEGDEENEIRGMRNPEEVRRRKLFHTIYKYFVLFLKQFFQIPKSWRQGAALVANWLMVLSLVGLGFFYWPLVEAEVRYETRQTIRQGSFGELLAKKITRTVENTPDWAFSVVIPKIDARARVLPNIDASSSREYAAALRQGVAHAKGTVFPGMDGTIYLFAHSAQAPWDIRRYNAVFYLLNKLEAGDEVIVFFQGIRYDYAVSEVRVVPPTETAFFGQRGEERLVLQTCHPPGTTRDALLVFAQPLR